MIFYLEKEIYAPPDRIRESMRPGTEDYGYIPLLREPIPNRRGPVSWQTREYTLFDEYSRTYSLVLEEYKVRSFVIGTSGYPFCVTGITERTGIKTVNFQNTVFMEFRYDLRGGWPAGLFIRRCMRKECWKDRCTRVLDSWKAEAERNYIPEMKEL